MRKPTRTEASRLDAFRLLGTVVEVRPNLVIVEGFGGAASIGNEVVVNTRIRKVYGEVSTVSATGATVMLNETSDSICLGDRVSLLPSPAVIPGDHWLGQIVNSQGCIEGGAPTATPLAGERRRLRQPPPDAGQRRQLGNRLRTGLMVTDTLLPMCRGQRVGLFAGSGVGKSTLIGKLAAQVDADRVVIAMIGERSREVNEFIHRVPMDIRSKCVFVVATAHEAPNAKIRAAYCAMTAAEHFRDQGLHTLLLFDSITRFAEAHREAALQAGETPALNAFPPSTVRVIAELVERAGPGREGIADITAAFAVLVAGSDMEEPVADMVRGLLDGHIVLSRKIAERGRYPAVDVLRSVSRSLPHAATESENAMLSDLRQLLSQYQDVEAMLRAGLYEPGSDASIDRAIALQPSLEGFLSEANPGDIGDAFARLASLLGGNANGQR